MEKIILSKALFDARSGKMQENKAVLVKDSEIADVFDRKQIGTEHGYEILDLSSQYLLPGLIDTHVHCNLNGETQPFQKLYVDSPAFIALYSLPFVQDDLMNGFTTVRDMGSVGLSDIALRDSIDRGIHWGPRIFCPGLPINILGGAGDSLFQAPYSGGKQNQVRAIVNGVDECRQAARFNLKYGADHLKVFATSSVLGTSLQAGPQEMTVDEMRAVVEVGNFAGKPTAAHAIGLNGIKAAIEAGVSSVEHASFLDQPTARQMADKGIFYVPTLLAVTRIQEHLTDETISKISREKAVTCSMATKNAFYAALEAGVKIAFGTDAATPHNKHGGQAAEFELLVRYGLSPAQALQTATLSAAELLRRQDSLGSLEKGKLADIVAVERDPLEDIAAMHKVSFVMKGGTVYKQTPSSPSQT